jgi:CheY-like chemotaxis protein/HPt (histidine-containing phosphotransfer) domain-containing protein
VLTNLVANAIKFTEKGEVLVRSRGEPADVGRYRFRFEVVDTGIGIRPENQAMIFQLFSQEDGSTTRRYGGTGLGLAICRQLVELMGGEIGVESQPTRGSTFWFTLPLDVVAPPGALASSAGLAPHLPLLALVVDDNATNREILQLQMQAWGVTVDQADSAAAALRCLERTDRRYDLVILDWHMPEVCGLELARMIRADERLRHLRLIMLSSGVADDGGRSAREAGIDICINKPVRQARLLECIIRALAAGDKAIGADTDRAAADDTATMASTGATVLLVEDNPVNREVATTMLQTLGCRVDTAVNGQEAVAKIRHEDFDLVLMDCEMPVMDGYAATAAIRAWEAGSAGRRVPILALTAHAMPEHRRKCLDIGMDDYLTKPFNMGQLRERIAQWLRVPAPQLTLAASGEPVAPRNPPGVSGKVLQFQALESIASLDPANGQALIGRLLEVYETSSRDLVDQIAGALARQHADGLRKAAHALRSSSGNVGAERLVECCRGLETAARAGDFTTLPGLVEALLAEHRSVIEQLRQWQTRKTA